MGQRNYTKFSQTPKEKENEPVVIPEVDLPVQPEGDQEVNVNVDLEKEPVVELDVETEDKPAATEKTILDDVMLYNCEKLNVRKEPSKTAEVVCVMDEDTEFTVCLEESTKDFFKVYTAVDDVLYEGYCVKEYIYIK